MAAGRRESDTGDGDVVELDPTAGFRVDVDAAPTEEIPPFPVEFVMDGKTTQILVSEPDNQRAMDIEEASVSREFFRLMFDDQWPVAAPFIESLKDRGKAITLALRYMRHFQLDTSKFVEDEEAANREQRRKRRRAARR